MAEPSPVELVFSCCCFCLRSSSTAKQTNLLLKLLFLLRDRERGKVLNPEEEELLNRTEARWFRSNPNLGTIFIGTVVVVTNPIPPPRFAPPSNFFLTVKRLVLVTRYDLVCACCVMWVASRPDI